eukprot:GDKJ01035062.1.p1 GENE.GDKJ01035062.1~~GDKJ01035062.1.p1  ORF type:complete len:576 (-),score=151.99 GDKJ01035062.1:38-1765(-)
MPAKAKQQQYEPESESDDNEEAGMFGGDPSKFLNKNFSREFMATLPAKIRDRTKLLITFDDEFLKQQGSHDAKMREIKMKYEKLYQPLFARRKDIVVGDAEPTEEEITKGFPEEHKGEVEIIPTAEDGQKDTVKGIPQFWLDALRHHVIIDQMISDRDAEVLEHLIDISGATLDNGFTIVFTFAPNEYFKESQVTKTVFTKKEFGQMAIDHTEETSISWNDGKDVTVETVTQKQRSKKGGAVRYVSKTEPCDSFFNMFKSHEESEEAEQWCSLAITICDKVAPFAVEYVTGEAPDGSSDMDDGEDYYGEEDEEDEEEENNNTFTKKNNYSSPSSSQSSKNKLVYGGSENGSPKEGENLDEQSDNEEGEEIHIELPGDLNQFNPEEDEQFVFEFDDMADEENVHQSANHNNFGNQNVQNGADSKRDSHPGLFTPLINISPQNQQHYTNKNKENTPHMAENNPSTSNNNTSKNKKSSNQLFTPSVHQTNQNSPATSNIPHATSRFNNNSLNRAISPPHNQTPAMHGLTRADTNPQHRHESAAHENIRKNVSDPTLYATPHVDMSKAKKMKGTSLKKN